MKNLAHIPAHFGVLRSQTDAPGTEGEPSTDNAPAAGEGTALIPDASAPANPYDAVFERVVFSLSETDREYPTQNGGSNKKLADVLVILRGGFASIPGSVYRRKTPNQPNTVEFTFIGSRQQNAIKPHDPASKAALTEFRNRVTNAFIAWYKAQPKAKTPTGANVTASVEFTE